MRRLALLPLLVACAEGEFVDPLTAFGEALIPTPSAVPHESDAMSHRSAMFAEAEGLELVNDDAAWVGMADMSCRIQVQSGWIDQDVDAQPEQTEEITDAAAGTVVTLTPNTIQSLDYFGTPTESLFVPGAVDARATTGGIVALSLSEEGCQVTDTNSGEMMLEGVSCYGGAGFDVDLDDGTAWVATNEGVFAVAAGMQPLNVADGDIVAWDRAARILYVADEGSNTIQALDADGNELWISKVGGPVAQLESLASSQGAYALVDLDGRGAQVWWLDAETGAPEQKMLVRTPVASMTVSPTGDRLGLVSQGQVDFFDVN